MKQIFLILFLLGFIGTGVVGEKPQAWASDLPPEETGDELAGDFPEALEESPSPGPGTSKTGALHAVGETFLRSRIDSLERRVLQLEDDLRFLEERTRNLDRQIDDLSRRH